MTRSDTYQTVTNKIIAALEQGTRPWMRPWGAKHLPGHLSFPIRANGERYRGINTLLLWIATAENQFNFNRFMTFKQAQALGGQVRKGEKGTLIVKYGTFTPSEQRQSGGEDEVQIPYLKGYSVFNVSQIDKLPDEYYQNPQPLPEEDRIEAAERFAENTGAKIRYGGNRAVYIHALDLVKLPPFLSFKNPESFYVTMFHELAHWTGAKHRLDRLKSTKKRSQEYAFEELVAEITGCFIAADLGIAVEPQANNASYLAAWLKHLREDKRAIFRAASKAQAAADFLHGLQPEDQSAESASEMAA